MNRHLCSVVVSSVIALAACGGGNDTDTVAELRAQADAAEMRALALAQVSTCAVDRDCSMISFEDAFPSCTQHRDFPMLAAAPSSFHAESAAATQRALAREARYAPAVVWNFACTAHVEPYPIPYCQQNQCKLRPWHSQ
jgi:hypothetical protein